MLQSGMKQDALDLWIMAARVLELDNKARRDLFLLAQSGIVGRTHANKLMWNLMTGPALGKEYLDLSNLVSHEVGKARREFDRPPRGNGDLQWWPWSYYQTPHKKDLRFAPTSVPRGLGRLVTGHGGKPLPHPECFGAA